MSRKNQSSDRKNEVADTTAVDAAIAEIKPGLLDQMKVTTETLVKMAVAKVKDRIATFGQQAELAEREFNAARKLIVEVAKIEAMKHSAPLLRKLERIKDTTAGSEIRVTVSERYTNQSRVQTVPDDVFHVNVTFSVHYTGRFSDAASAAWNKLSNLDEQRKRLYNLAHSLGFNNRDVADKDLEQFIKDALIAKKLSSTEEGRKTLEEIAALADSLVSHKTDNMLSYKPAAHAEVVDD